MVSVIPASQVSIALLEERYGLREATQPDFFGEWLQGLEELTELEKQYLDRVKTHFKASRWWCFRHCWIGLVSTMTHFIFGRR
jgi:hypothetical protein